ncbi:hypothetical protein BX600DRAFT_253100 [Xylariales sp. PMI_506]|nr:hypothetical protein BX600DRAFT_253100 [Xylariales sp. PMI_506]
MVIAELSEDLLDPTVKLEFQGVEAYIFTEVQAHANGTYSINLFASDSPIGLGIPGLSVGVLFYVDLVFSLLERIDMTGGFYVSIPNGSYLVASIFGGDITNILFDGIGVQSIPVTVQSGSATFKADLRLRVQCGAETTIGVLGVGAGAVVGIYANILEFVTTIDSTPDCALESKEWWNLNAGAYAQLDVVVDYSTMGPVPTVSTTLLTASTLTQCWVSTDATSSVDPTPTSPAGSDALPATSVYSLLFSPTSISTYLQSGSPIAVPTVEAYVMTSHTASINTVSWSTTAIYRDSSAALSRYTTIHHSIANTSFVSTPATASARTLVLSTVCSTAVYTATSCGTNVVNCPISHQMEVVVTQTITVGVATRTHTTTLGLTHAVTTPTVQLTLCATPVVETFIVSVGGAVVSSKAASTTRSPGLANVADALADGFSQRPSMVSSSDKWANAMAWTSVTTTTGSSPSDQSDADYANSGNQAPMAAGAVIGTTSNAVLPFLVAAVTVGVIAMAT